MANPQPDKFTKISTELVEKFAGIRISGEAWQVLWVILRKTYGFKKKEDWISLSQFYGLTRINIPNIGRALRKLISMKLIIKKDNGKNPKYALNKDYDQWEPLSKKTTPSKKTMDSLLSKKTTLMVNNDKSMVNNDNQPLSIKTDTIDILTIDTNTIDNTTKDKLRDGKAIGRLIGYFQEKYVTAFEVKYILSKGKDPKHIKELLLAYKQSEDFVKALIDQFFSTKDKWIKFDAECSIGILRFKANKLVQELYRNRMGLSGLSPAGQSTVLNLMEVFREQESKQ